MHGEARDASGGDRLHEALQILVIAPAVVCSARVPRDASARVPRDSNTALDRDGNIDRVDHRACAVGHDVGRFHERRAEASLLDARARAADVQVDLVVAEGLADFRRTGQRVRLRATELQAHGMLRRVEAKQPVAVAAQHGLRVDHLAVEEHARADLPQEVAAVPVGPRHHRRDAQPAVECVHSSSARLPGAPHRGFGRKGATGRGRATGCGRAGNAAKRYLCQGGTDEPDAGRLQRAQRLRDRGGRRHGAADRARPCSRPTQRLRSRREAGPPNDLPAGARYVQADLRDATPSPRRLRSATRRPAGSTTW